MENVDKGGGEVQRGRANSLHSLHVDSLTTPRTASVRSKSIARSSFPHVSLPNRYKVFARLKEKLDPVKKDRKIKCRLHLAKICGILNLRRMELQTGKYPSAHYVHNTTVIVFGNF